MTKRHWSSPDANELVQRMGLEDPVEAITMVVRNLIDEAGLTGPPADLEILASYRDVIKIQTCKMDSAGRLVPRQDGKWIIYINDSHSSEKQRFTIAHEIAHTLLPTYTGQYIDDDDTGRFSIGDSEGQEKEYLCDAGGAALLLDARWLRTFINDRPIDLNLLNSAARVFQASLHATMLQLVKIAAEPIAFVIWESEVTPTPYGWNHYSSQLSVSSVARSETFPSDCYIPVGTSIPEDSPVFQAIQEPSKHTREHFSFDFGGTTGVWRLSSEHWYVPFNRRPRVISILKPPKANVRK